MLNKMYLWKYWSSVLETWHHKCACASQKRQNDTLSAVAISTLSASVSFCQKTKYPHLQPLNWHKRVLLETDIVSRLSSLPSLDWLGWMALVLIQKWEFQFLLTQYQQQNCCHGNMHICVQNRMLQKDQLCRAKLTVSNVTFPYRVFYLMKLRKI